ncbi:MAG: hypothetical protein ACI9U2_001176 [Bradymonadia bacterium]|jgi:hypothetical protein
MNRPAINRPPMKRTLLALCAVVFVAAWAVLLVQWTTAPAPSSELRFTSPAGPERYVMNCNPPKVQIAQRDDQVWAGCETGGEYWLTRIDYIEGLGRMMYRLPGPLEMIMEDPGGDHIALVSGDHLYVQRRGTMTLEKLAETRLPVDIAWKDGRAWAIEGHRQLFAHSADEREAVLTLEPAPGRRLTPKAVDIVDGKWRVIAIDAPDGKGDARLVWTQDGATLHLIMPLPETVDPQGSLRWRRPLILTGAARRDVSYGPLVQWDGQAWQIHSPPGPVDAFWSAERYASKTGADWIAYATESTRAPGVGRVHDQWIHFGDEQGRVGFTPETVAAKMRPRYQPTLRPLGDGYVLSGGFGASFARLDAKLQRTDALGWVGRVSRLYNEGGWEASAIKSSVWRALVLPWVLLLFPLMLLATVRLRRRVFLVVWLLGVGIMGTTYWELVQLV